MARMEPAVKELLVKTIQLVSKGKWTRERAEGAVQGAWQAANFTIDVREGVRVKLIYATTSSDGALDVATIWISGLSGDDKISVRRSLTDQGVKGRISIV